MEINFKLHWYIFSRNLDVSVTTEEEKKKIKEVVESYDKGKIPKK